MSTMEEVLTRNLEAQHPYKRQRLESDGKDELGHDADLLPSHPLDVRPSGNAILGNESTILDIRPNLGAFAALPDELLAYFLEYLNVPEVLSIGATCKVFYAFTTVDELWRKFFEDNPPADFKWRSSWRKTFLSLPDTTSTNISCLGLHSDYLYRPFFCAHVNLTRFSRNIPARNAIPRLSNLTEEIYSSRWHNQPFILKDLVRNWPIFSTWDTDFLLKNFPNVKFRAESLEWTLERYVEYMRNTADESPLYLFDKSFKSSLNLSSSTSIDGGEKKDFWTSPCFGEDLFTHLGSHRPDSTWLILGPARSGSTVHVDPNGTSAWNAVLRGAKYWLMFPPPSPADQANGTGFPPGVIISSDASEITAPVSIPEYLLSFHDMARAFPGVKEGICYEGEVLHVPAGWFHLVFNLTESLAITGNFVHKSKLPDVLQFMRDKPEQVSGFDDAVEDPYRLFVERLRDKRPDLLEEAENELKRRTEKSGESGANGVKRKGKWEEVKKGDEQGGGFTFGFGGDSEDEDDED